MKKQTLFLVLLLLVLTGSIGIVSAETLTGTLGGSVYSQSLQNTGQSGTDIRPNFTVLLVNNIQYSANTVSIICWDNVDLGDYRVIVTPGAPAGAATNFIGRLTNSTGPQIVTGTIGYQRVFLPTDIETVGYQYAVFNNNWNITGLSGSNVIYLEYDRSAVYGMYKMHGNPDTPTANGDMFFSQIGLNTGVRGNYSRLISDTTYATYEFTKPSGLGITGNITRSPYVNKMYVFNSTSESIIATDLTFTTLPLSINTDKQVIRLGLKSAAGTWYNSSLLFTSAIPPPTPTPTPTVTLLPGQFWTTFAAQDATTGGLIPGAEIDIYSRFTGTWNNATTSTGERTIATSSNNYYDVNGNASGYSSGSLTNVMAYNNAYYLVNLFPTTGLPSVPGQINLFVSVTERETGLPISGASVSVATPGSWTVQGETDNKGIEVFSTSNSSVKYITVSKTGYKAETRTITTPASGNYNAVLQMSRIVVTTVPTGYIPPGGVTPVTTMDSRSTTEKDTDMMNIIRDSGPQLIQLAIAVTMISLLGLMTKGFGK